MGWAAFSVGGDGLEIKEVRLCDGTARELIALSADWEAEGSCHGYRKNEYGDLEGNRIFLAEENGAILGYLFGKAEEAKAASSVMEEGTPCFEVEELYVKPAHRSKGVGAALFRHAEETVRTEAEFITLGTATKNFRAILHFYIDELGMEFWSARLFKRL